MKSFFERVIEFITSRVFIMLTGVFVMFAIIGFRLFDLQIVNGQTYMQDLKLSIIQNMSIPASRGMIYDRYGRPLAVNDAAFSIKFDDSINVSLENRTKSLYDIVKEHKNQITDTLPFDNSKHISFTFETLEEENKFKQSIGLSGKELKYTAEETYNYLLQKHNVPEDLTEEEKRKFISLSMESTDKMLMMISLANILNENNEAINDDLPITKDRPYQYLFNNNEEKELSWKKSVYMPKDMYGCTPQESIDYLIDYFNIPECISPEMQRDVLSIRYSLYLVRYRKYQPITVAVNVSDKTVASIEENNSKFPGASVYTDSLRSYPDGLYFSNIIGYIGKINDTEYDEYKDYGYTQNDILGKNGIEKLYELELRGTDGESLVEIDASGRRISTLDTTPPVSGSNVFLTIDKNLQIAAYNQLEQALSDTLISKLLGTYPKDSPISLKELFTSMVNCNSISISEIFKSDGEISEKIKSLIYEENPDFDLSDNDAADFSKLVITNSIENNTLTNKEMTLLLIEQGIITGNEEYVNNIKEGNISPLSVIIKKLETRELQPYKTNLDPCTGSVVVSDVNTGEVLALVTYPAYDNNYLVNNFDSSYYSKLINDPTTPLVNRPLKQKKAPGSTLKMVTAIAGLESDVITPYEIITDMGQYTKAGTPYPKCWIYPGGTHQNLTVAHALEVSCNYFFYETSFRLGNSTDSSTEEGIETLNKYMEAFGLNSVTGIELSETKSNMASPEYKEQTIKWQNPDATQSQTRWTDGDTVRAAIGQSVNNYTPAVLNKYVATLASGGTRYQYHIIDKVEDAYGNTTEEKLPVVEEVIDISEESLDAVYEGMRLVTNGSRGTLRTVFKDFPVNVAAKSGTAQENLTRSSHTWFVGFAPYEDPQIAITVMIPFGESSYSPAAIVGREIIAEYMGLNYEGKNSYLDTKISQ